MKPIFDFLTNFVHIVFSCLSKTRTRARSIVGSTPDYIFVYPFSEIERKFDLSWPCGVDEKIAN